MTIDIILLLLVLFNFYIDAKHRKASKQDEIKIQNLESTIDVLSKEIYTISNELRDQLSQPVQVTASDFQIVASNLEAAQDRLAELDLIAQNIQIMLNKEINNER